MRDGDSRLPTALHKQLKSAVSEANIHKLTVLFSNELYFGCSSGYIWYLTLAYLRVLTFCLFHYGNYFPSVADNVSFSFVSLGGSGIVPYY